MNTVTAEHVAAFLAGCAAKHEVYRARVCPSLAAPVFSAMTGNRYIRIVREDAGSRSSHCFIDRTNGDVLKCAGWKAPAKHARGNLFRPDGGLDCIGPHGAAYLR